MGRALRFALASTLVLAIGIPGAVAPPRVADAAVVGSVVEVRCPTADIKSDPKQSEMR